MTDPIAARTPPAEWTILMSPALALPAVDPTALTTIDPSTLADQLATARRAVDSLVRRFRDNAKANAEAAKTARIELARAKLRALRLAAALKAVKGDGRGALMVAEEAARLAQSIKGLGAAGPATGTVASVSGEARAARGTPAGAASETAIDGVVQTAHEIIAMARRATRPGSPEERIIERLRRATGTPQPAAGIGGDDDGRPAAAERSSLDLTA